MPSERADAGTRLLVVEDDPDVSAALVTALEHAGHDVRSVSSGEAALALASSWHPELVVLDVNLPGMDGFDTCRALRRGDGDLPVIFLTARREVDDLRQGFDGGADDYLTKPFSVEELKIRIGAALRRGRRAQDDGDRLEGGHVALDLKARRVWVDGVDVHLTPTELRFLHYLMANAGQALSREQIVDYVWRYEFGGDARIVETYVSGLRKKLDVGPETVIRTVRGYGYSFDAGARP